MINAIHGSFAGAPSPDAIAFGSKLWVNASFGVTRTGVNTVPRIEDQSGNDYDMLQPTSSNQASFAFGQNNLPTLNFTQTFGIPKYTISLGTNLVAPYWVIAVAKFINTSGISFLFDSPTGSDRNYLYSNGSSFVVGSGTDIVVRTANTNTNIHAMKFNGASSQYSLNGDTWTNHDFGTPTLKDILIGQRFSGTFFFNGQMPAFIIETDATRAANTIAYLKTKYAIS